MIIKNLKIKNFKSIRNLEIDCARVNVFIGEPNTGKSNILEALGMYSFLYYGSIYIKDIVEFLSENQLNNSKEKSPSELYHLIIQSQLLLGVMEDVLKSSIMQLSHHGQMNGFITQYVFKNVLKNFVRFSNFIDIFHLRSPAEISISTNESELKISLGIIGLNILYDNLTFYRNSRLSVSFTEIEKTDAVKYKFYRYSPLDKYPLQHTEFLFPPDGRNLRALIEHNEELQEFVNDLLSPYGFKIGLLPAEDTIEIIRETKKGVIITYPYTLLSDTIRRVIFYTAAILTAKNSVIIMEEPESHSFPYHTKILAESIAMNKDNQYFISTHNPYFLLSLIEKAEDIAVFVTKYEGNETKVYQADISKIYDLASSVFFNLDDLVMENEGTGGM